MNTHTISDAEARKLILNGIIAIADPVSSTMGPAGRTVLLKDSNNKTIATKDGVTVSKSIFPKHPVESMGADLVKDAAQRTAEIAGDGTSTCTVLAAAMVKQAEKLIASGVSQTLLRSELPIICSRLTESIKSFAKPCKNFDDLLNVALIASNNDMQIAEPVAKAVWIAGLSGRITLDDARIGLTHLETSDGLFIKGELLSTHFANINGRLAAGSNEAYVVLSRFKLSTFDNIMHIMKLAQENKKPLILIFSDYEQTAFQALVQNKVKANMNVIACKLKTTSYDEISDIAIALGTTLFDPNNNKQAEYASIKRFYVEQSLISIIPDNNSNAIQHSEFLRKTAEDSTSIEVKDSFIRRASLIASKHCLIKVAAPTDAEAIEKKHRAEDAIAACKGALEYGIISGGGIALINAYESIDLTDISIATQSIVKEGVEAPLKAIMSNAGRSFDWFTSCKTKTSVYDAKSNKILNGIPSWLIDPVIVTKSAFENASSVCRTFVALSSVIYQEA